MKRKTAPALRAMKGKSPIVALTAYTYPMATFLDPFVDMILVGDSLSMVLYGNANTLSVSLETMIEHGKAVVRGSRQALVVIDMPFGSYEASPQQAFANAARVLSETGAGAVKIEGHAEMVETAAFLVARGIPVMGHVGLRPQHINTMGGFALQGKDEAAARSIAESAFSLADAGCFAVVIEGVPEALATQITKDISVPSIGIGASPRCDGQVLVTEDMLGLFPDFKPAFAKQYKNLRQDIQSVVENYASEVRSGTFDPKAL
jgi:3-methyl-2-oxobutanoate hydroxymethyltransferase